MKRMLKIGFILCVAFSLIACSFLQTLMGELGEEAAVTEYIPAEPVEPEVEQSAPTDALTEAPTPVSLVHRIVYEKTGNIWAVDPGTNEVVQVTQDGSMDSTASEAVKYFRPLSSPDGAYVAFSTSTRFYIYSFASLETDEIVKASSPDILADVLLGWSEDNLLYYTRTNGGCDLSVTPLKGPDSVDVMRYDPVSGSSEKVSTLPKVEDASHAYSIGKNMTPSGRFITAYNAACSVGFGSTFLWDVQNETYVMNPQGDAILSNDESTIAYVDDTNFEMAGLTTIVGVDRVSQSQETLYAPSMAGYVMTDVSWSPDDSFIAFLEWYVLDPAQARGMGGFFNPDALDSSYLVLVANDAGGDMPEMHFIPERRHTFGSWSPDGREVVYIQLDEGAGRNGPAALMIYDLDTSTTTVIDRGEGIGNPDW